jgi:hypothetical protein
MFAAVEFPGAMNFGDLRHYFVGNPLAVFVRGLWNIENGKCDTVTDISIHWRTQSGGSENR